MARLLHEQRCGAYSTPDRAVHPNSLRGEFLPASGESRLGRAVFPAREIVRRDEEPADTGRLGSKVQRQECIVMSPGNTPAELRYHPLRKDHPLGLLADTCLPLRAPRYARCRACEDVCPVQALHVEETLLRLDETCVSCGRCAAACPMGALGLPGFSVPDVPRVPLRPLAVDCWKVPARLTPDDSLRFPCLGGLSPGRILEMVMAAGPRPVELLDRGWCATCSAGNCGAAAEQPAVQHSAVTHPVAVSLKSARSLLEAAGSGPERLPRLRALHLPADLMPVGIPPPASETKMSRRGFFSALTAKATVAVDQIRPLPATEARRRRGFERQPVPSKERQRILFSMEYIAQSAWLAPPPGLFHRVEVSAVCCNHQLCASICPTGALAAFEESGRNELMFDTQLCIGCGECHAICPSGALSLLPNGYNADGEALPEHPIRLTSFAEKSCPECGQAFADKAGEDLCPQCEKRRNLASSAFQSLFGSRR
jgi:ferredoxin